MRQYFLQSIMSALLVLALAAAVPSTSRAQDRPDDRNDQHAPMPADHHDDHPAARPDAGRPDPVVQYRHDHPHASARCHDGFFTSTSDRSRACTKHGGIDVWLSL
jgi:ABC-type nickel/cobalt efflux system permease component RcnA